MPRTFLSSLMIICLAIMLGAGCSSTEPQSQVANQLTITNMQITSPAFGPNQSIPSQYTCDGQGKNPTLEWAEAPASAKSFVMILDDPDAPSGDFVHWLVFNIPADVTRIAEGEAPSGVIGRSSLGTNAYVSPCPPSGRHRYFFKLFALDSLLDLPAASTKAQVELAMQGHILDQTELIGLYQR